MTVSLLFVSLSLFICHPRSSATNIVIIGITQTGPCSCNAEFKNGSHDHVYDISSTPWKKFAFPMDNGVWYYSPCQAYDVPNDKDGNCTAVGVCLEKGGKFYNYGKASSATWGISLNVSQPMIRYSGIDGNATVTLYCDLKDETFTGVVINGSARFTLSSKCSCPDLCTAALAAPHSVSPLSGGSIVLIIFFSLVFVYIVGGLLFLRFSRGATGLEMIPNYHFWISLPGLIKDGVMFLLNGCATHANYEKI